jgi:hypothetical protein
MYVLTTDNELIEVNQPKDINGKDILAVIATRASHPYAKHTQDVLHWFSKDPKRQTSPEQILDGLQRALSTQ